MLRNSKLYIFLVLLLSFVLRLIHLNQSFWLDEAAQVIESARPFKLQFQIVSDFHPPLYHLLLHFWMFLGQSEIWIRLLSVIFAVLSIFLAYLFAKEFTDNKKALISAFLLAIAPYHIWYSQEARPYMLFILISLFSSYCLLKKKWFLYTISAILSVYSFYFSAFMIVGHLAYILFQNKKLIKRYIISNLAAFLAFLPWLPFFSKQLQNGMSGAFSGWSYVVSVSALKLIPLTLAKFVYGRGTIDNNIYYGLLILPVILIFIYSVFQVSADRKGKSLLILFFTPLFFSFIASFFFAISAPQRLIFLLPLFFLIISKAADLTVNYWKIFLGVVIITSLLGIFDYYTNPNVQREQWRQAVNYINSTSDPQTSMSLFVFPEPFAPVQWYKLNNSTAGIAPKFNLTDQDLIRSEETITNKKTIYLFQYLTGLTDRQNKTQRYLTGLGYQELRILNFPGVGFIYIYDKK